MPDSGHGPLTYQRPDADPVAPLVARRLDGQTMGIHEHPLSEASTPRPRLILVSDPLAPEGHQVVGPHDGGPVAFLPPPCAISTLRETGALDDEHLDFDRLFGQHEKHLVDQTFRCDKSGLNYFPDPMVYDAWNAPERTQGVDLTMADAAGAVFAPLGEDNQPAKLVPRRAFLPGKYSRWPDAIPFYLFLFGDRTPRLEARNYHAEFYLPPGWTGAVRALNFTTGATLAEVALFHATTAPRLRPKWVDVKNLLDRAPKETAARFEGQIELNPRSTGAVRVTGYWNEYWDEPTPLHFVEATIQPRVSSGSLVPDGAVVVAPGDGYGTRARVVFESDTPDWETGATLPELEPVLNAGKLTALIVHSPGAKLPFALRIRVLRRPPRDTFAQGRVTKRGDKAGIEKVEITDGGGFYDRAPLVVFHDLKADGAGAQARAILNAEGRVSAVEFPDKSYGSGYSDDVAVGFFTHSKELEEYPVAPPGSPSPEESRYEQNGVTYPEVAAIEFHQDFGDACARSVSYVGDASSRFRDILPDKARSRVSVPLRVAVQATERPPRPEWHHHAYAYRWLPDRTANEPVSLAPDAGELEVRREGAIRCYLRRGWHATGEELLGVIVMQVARNGIDFPAGSGVRADYLATLTKEERPVVSRWGYDPVWDDVATPPLTLDDLTNQVDFIPYESLGLAPEAEKRFTGVALHRAQYDPDKELWYVDVGLRTPAVNLPFLQLAIARYQGNALDGFELSEIVQPDPVRVPGDRLLRVSRSHAGGRGLTVSLSGPFAANQDPKPYVLPAREVLVEVRRRQSGFAPEFEGPLVLNSQADVPLEFDKGELGSTRVKLNQASGDPRTFQGQVVLPAAAHDLYLRVIEREVYASDEPQRDRTGDTDQVRLIASSPDPSGMVRAAEWRPFTCAVLIE